MFNVKYYWDITLEGRTSNRNGYGARVEINAGGLRRYRRIHSGSSFLSQSEAIAVFGLGDTAVVDDLWVFWPSGITDHVRFVEANQEIRILEEASPLEKSE